MGRSSADLTNQETLVIWGGGGHAKVVLDAVRTHGSLIDRTVIVDDVIGGTVHQVLGVRVIGTSRVLDSLAGSSGTQFLIAIGDNAGRARCFHAARELGLDPITLVDARASVSESAQIDPGTLVLARAIVNACAKIGQDCIVNTGAIVEHDCRVGSHTHIAPGAILGGWVTVGSYVLVGLGAIILPRIAVGDGATIGAGAVVTKAVAAGTTVVGNPGRVVKR
jgi:UDP-perosamine 4-acetyltransferase